MKLNIKLINNETFEVEAELSQTVLATKQKIAELRGPAFEVSLQKLIHAGKVLKDETTLAEAGVKEGGFIVAMVSKPKTAAPAPPAAAPPASSPAAPPAAAAAVSAPAAAPSSAPTAAPAADVNPFAGPEFEASVEAIKGMGYPDDQIRAALRAAFGNPDRAVEYLMSGIPPAAMAAATQRAAMAAGGAAPAGAARSSLPPGHPLEQLRAHPQFADLQRLVHRNPQQLPGVLAQIGVASPSLMELIDNNKEAFLVLMNEPISEGVGGEGDFEEGEGEDEGMMMGEEGDMDVPPAFAQMAAMLSTMTPEQRAAMATQFGLPPEQMQQIAQLGSMMAAARGGGGEGGAPGGMPPGAVAVRLTEPEMAAVDRLAGMGFDRNRVLEAYLLCDKNEEMAANYLLEHGFDEQ